MGRGRSRGGGDPGHLRRQSLTLVLHSSLSPTSSYPSSASSTHFISTRRPRLHGNRIPSSPQHPHPSTAPSTHSGSSAGHRELAAVIIFVLLILFLRLRRLWKGRSAQGYDCVCPVRRPRSFGLMRWFSRPPHRPPQFFSLLLLPLYHPSISYPPTCLHSHCLPPRLYSRISQRHHPYHHRQQQKLSHHSSQRRLFLSKRHPRVTRSWPPRLKGSGATSFCHQRPLLSRRHSDDAHPCPALLSQDG